MFAAVPAQPALAHHVEVARSETSRPGPRAGKSRVYTVASGDTVWEIARRHHSSVAAIVAANALRSGGAVIAVGDRLQIPAGGATAQRPSRAIPSRSAEGPRTSSGKRVLYVVRAGDTVGAIAARYRVSIAAVVSANGLANAHVIRVGQRLTIPGARGASTAAPATALPRPKQSTPAKPSKKTSKATSTKAPTGLSSSPAVNRRTLAAMEVPTRSATRDLIVATARRHGVDPSLALAIGWQESGWNQRAVSFANAIGTMQVMPTSGTWASDLVGRRLNLLDTQDNITAGVVILRALKRSAKSLDQAIAGYYQGLYSVQSRGMYGETKTYVANIRALMRRM